MILSCGLIGLPNVGKSTLFNALTKLNVPALNFPFCTIKPNIGIVSVLDKRLKILANIMQSKKIVYDCIKFIDIAGLVKGASNGEGLGNEFLNNIRNVDIIIHVVRCFQDSEILHINKQINPLLDIAIINEELILSDLSQCQNILRNFNKKNKVDKIFFSNFNRIFKCCINNLKKKRLLKSINFSEEDKNILFPYRLLTLKPVMYILNSDNNKVSIDFYKEIKSFMQKEKNNIIAIKMNVIKNKISNNIENILNDNVLSKIDCFKIFKNCLNLLNLHTFFTIGKKEARSWFFCKNSNSVQVAKIIHTDFSTGFIRVKVISYKDFLIYKNEKKIRSAGKLRIEGKKYIIKDGEILNFLFNV